MDDSDVRKIMSIQNTERSLMWGRHFSVDQKGEHYVFAVGHKAYPKRCHYFMVRDYNVYALDEDTEIPCPTIGECVSAVICLLKKWFPEKGVNEDASEEVCNKG